MFVKDTFDKFGKYVVQQSRSNLTRKKKNASKELYNSLSYDIKQSKNSFEFSISMEDYWAFLDYGVTGADPSFKGKDKNGNPKSFNRSQKGFRFGSGNFKGKGGQWEKRIDQWMYSRGIQPRDKDSGKFMKRETVNYLIRRSIYNLGTEATNFFSLPFERAFKSLPDEIVNAYGLDMEALLQNAINN